MPEAGRELARNLPWMTWNLALAIVPLVLALLLFRRTRPLGGAWRSPGWWAALLAFVLFLPNAPYVLTDVVHLVGDVRRVRSTTVVVAVLLPAYGAFFVAGFEAYVLSVLRLTRWLQASGFAHWRIPVELTLHALSAVGIYLGRVHRFNSWDVMTVLDTASASAIAQLSQPRPLGLIAFTFAALATGYALLRWLHLAVAASRA